MTVKLLEKQRMAHVPLVVCGVGGDSNAQPGSGRHAPRRIRSTWLCPEEPIDNQKTELLVY